MSLATARRRVTRTLDTLGLYAPLARGRERLRVARMEEPPLGSDGLPFPPARLRVLVDWDSTADEFIANGRSAVEMIERTVADGGVEIDSLGAILDFGCGCGRVARHFRTFPGDLHGCDYNPKLVAWCQEALPFMEARTNALDPPSPYEDQSFDLIYAISILTHLTEPIAHAWVDDWFRILKPGGLLLATTHGGAFEDYLTDEERVCFERGDMVVQQPKVVGMNACAAYHPRPYVTERLLRRFEVVSPGEARFLGQDIYLARRPA